MKQDARKKRIYKNISEIMPGVARELTAICYNKFVEETNDCVILTYNLQENKIIHEYSWRGKQIPESLTNGLHGHIKRLAEKHNNPAPSLAHVKDYCASLWKDHNSSHDYLQIKVLNWSGPDPVINISKHIADGSTELDKYCLYHIWFAFSDWKEISAEFRNQVIRGYYGITRRGILRRFMEHYDKAGEGTGFLLHDIWRMVNKTHSGLRLKNERGIAVHLTLVDSAHTLPEIYDMEEKAVEYGTYCSERTLRPDGLNAIPGGYAGIRFLHELGVTKNNKLSPEQRDDILASLGHKKGGTPCPHYRRAHLRQYPNGKIVPVRDCWVALDTKESGYTELYN